MKSNHFEQNKNSEHSPKPSPEEIRACVAREVQANSELDNVNTYTISSEVLEELELDDLPVGIALMGGGARAVAQKALFNEDAPIRDIDLVAIEGVSEFTDNELDEIGRDRMPDDYEYGHGAEWDTLEDYFESRDFTLNEVLVIGDTLLISEQGEEDLRNKVIRPTVHEASYDDYYGVGPKIAIKSQLMQAVFEEVYGEASCEGIDREAIINADDFYVALALNKAMQYGDSVTERFLNRLYDKQSWPNDEVVKLALDLSDETNFSFRGSGTGDMVSAMSDDLALTSDLSFSEYRQMVDEEFDVGISPQSLESAYGDQASSVALLDSFGGTLSDKHLKNEYIDG